MIYQNISKLVKLKDHFMKFFSLNSKPLIKTNIKHFFMLHSIAFVPGNFDLVLFDLCKVEGDLKI